MRFLFSICLLVLAEYDFQHWAPYLHCYQNATEQTVCIMTKPPPAWTAPVPLPPVRFFYTCTSQNKCVDV